MNHIKPKKRWGQNFLIDKNICNKIVSAIDLENNAMLESYGGYGNTVVVHHANSISSLYAHLNAWSVNVDQYVFTGEQIGTCGTTGLSTGPHLHIEIRISGVPVDPMPYLP